MYEDKKKKGGGKKKGSAKESDAQEAKNLVDDMPVDEVAGAGKGKKHPKKDHKKVAARKKGGAKKDVMMDENMSGGGRKKGAAQYKEEGAADFKGGLHAKNTKHSESGEHLGAKRMGFTQNFGAARQNSYAQGAAKVTSIMSFGASKKKGAADHIAGHPVSEVKLDNIAPSGGVKTSYGKQNIRDLIKSQGEYDANTTQISQNLAELDSLKRVASGTRSGRRTDGGASGLYGYGYNSSMPLDGKNIGRHKTNSGYGGGLDFNQRENVGKLRKQAREIQGDRPKLDE
tara:strand:+ start:43 stop:900 length:858 start_codon:yes stop_codon:yes gene_type:complete